MLRFITTLFLVGFVSQFAAAQIHFASGIKIGEVDQTSAIIWARLTDESEPNFELLGPVLKNPMPENIVPGKAGWMQISYRESEKPETETLTDWIRVDAKTDFTHQFSISDLKPATKYQLTVNARTETDGATVNSIEGTFKTAPETDQKAPIRFIVTTCQAVQTVDSKTKGHAAYLRMLDFNPDFFVHTGDILYYDKKPIAKTVARARAKWNLTFGYEYNRKFHQQVASYFMKDDHDTLYNDCWPGQTYGSLTFERGLEIFREQVPMGEKTYRTYRWGSDVQIWMTENRDFRTPNTQKDGPEKTILGSEQKAWLMESISNSDARYKFLITPGPIVGPDKPGKADNHANQAFDHEGQQLRDFVAKQERTYVICGDRHWQYLSKDPKTGILELGCGAINDQHNLGGDPGEKPDFHRYFNAKGGFLGITVEDGIAEATWFGVNGENGDVLPKAKALHVETLGVETE